MRFEKKMKENFLIIISIEQELFFKHITNLHPDPKFLWNIKAFNSLYEVCSIYAKVNITASFLYHPNIPWLFWEYVWG